MVRDLGLDCRSVGVSGLGGVFCMHESYRFSRCGQVLVAPLEAGVGPRQPQRCPVSSESPDIRYRTVGSDGVYRHYDDRIGCDTDEDGGNQPKAQVIHAHTPS